MFIKMKSFGKDRLINTDHIIMVYDGPKRSCEGEDTEPFRKLVVVMRDGKVVDVDMTLDEFIRRIEGAVDLKDITKQGRVYD